MQTLHFNFQIQPQPPTSTVSILSKLRQPSTTPIAVSEQKEMSINGGINDHECCREAANKSPLLLTQNRNQSLEEGEERGAHSQADGDGGQPPPASPLTSRNELLFLRRSERQTRSNYRSQSPAIQPQQPPTSANTANQPPSSSIQQPTPTLTSHDHLLTTERSSPSNRTKPSLPSNRPKPSSPDLVNGTSS